MSLPTKLDETISNAEKFLKSFSSQPLKKYTEKFVGYCSDSVKNCPDWVVTISEYNDEGAVISCSYTLIISRTDCLPNVIDVSNLDSTLLDVGTTKSYPTSLEVYISESRIEIQYYVQPSKVKITAVYQISTDAELEQEPNPLKRAANLLSYLYSL